jgi:serine/threonine protein kinase
MGFALMVPCMESGVFIKRLSKLFRLSIYQAKPLTLSLLSINPPEPFLWHVFHSIANAVCYNAYGNTDGTLKPGWVPIVHRDIKPDNSESLQILQSIVGY